MKRVSALFLVGVLVLCFGTGVMVANSSFLNGFRALMYYSMRIDEQIPTLDPLWAGVREFEQAIRRGESEFEAHLMVALIFLTLEQPEEALPHLYVVAEHLGTKETWIHALIGETHLQAGSLGFARRSYEKALEDDAELAVAYNGLGRIAFLEESWDEALGFFQQSVDISPGFFHGYLNLGKTQYYLQESLLAKESLEKANRLNPHVAEVHFYLGLAYEELELFSQAEHAYSRAYQLDPFFGQEP